MLNIFTGYHGSAKAGLIVFDGRRCVKENKLPVSSFPESPLKQSAPAAIESCRRNSLVDRQ